MKFRALALSLLMFWSCLGEAALRCGQAHAILQPGTPQYLANRLDALNEVYNNFAFSRSLVEVLNEDQGSKPFYQRQKARYQVWKLSRALKALKDAESWDKYEFENFARRLEKLAFLADPSVTQGMSRAEKNDYQQARHSIIADGLEHFLFEKKKVSPTTSRRIYEMIKKPFQPQYLRWVAQLNGVVLPWEVAMKVAWAGTKRTQADLEPYQNQTTFKANFNLLSTVWNWMLVSAIFVGLPAYGYHQHLENQELGRAKAIEVFTPMLEESQRMAAPDYFSEQAKAQDLENVLVEFRLTTNREPTPDEMAKIKALIEGSSKVDETTVNIEAPKVTEESAPPADSTEN